MRLLAAGAVIFSIPAVVVSMLLIVRAPQAVLPVGIRAADMLPFLILQFAFTGVGSLRAWRRPENRIGWMLCGTAFVSAALFLMAGFTAQAIASGDTVAVATSAWLYSWSSVLLGATLGPALATFPDGRLRSRASLVSLLLLAVTLVLSIVAVALRPGPLPGLPVADNPYAWRDHGGLLDAIFAVAIAAGLGATVFGVSGQISRFRRSPGVERQQLKWFLASTAVMSVLLVVSVAWSYGAPESGATSAQRYAGRVTGALASVALPLAIGVAILRYRLYDIDLLIRRTLVYAGVSAVLAAAYIAAVVLTGAALRPFTAGSDLAVAASTLVVVALFQPIRRRIGELVDRRFYRSRYDAVRTLDSFGARLRHEVELDAVRADLVGVVHETIRPAHASLWLRENER